MKRIYLQNDRGFALVDDDDYENLKKYRWYAHTRKSSDTRRYPIYAYTPDKSGVRQKTIMMHRMIMKAPKGQFIDHIDGNGLNNQKNNLRVCTVQENGFNQRHQVRKTSSKYKGVRKKKDVRFWEAYIKHNQKWIFLGQYSTEIEAATAYNTKAIELFGEFALLNQLPKTSSTSALSAQSFPSTGQRYTFGSSN